MNKIFTGSTLKILAVISMLTDHFGQIILKNGLALNAPYSMFTDKQFKLLLSAIEICHILGRIAFPVFCFLVVEGFLHTHSLKKYLLHLGMFAILSEPIYDLAFGGKIFSLSQQNVLFTLLLGVLVLAVIKNNCKNVALCFVIVGIGAFIAYICKLDGGYYGICLIVIFYIFRNKSVYRYVAAILLMYICGMEFSLKGLIDPYFLTAVCSLVLIYFYNGKRGMKMKYFFYIFYPAHLVTLFVVSVWIASGIK